MRQLVVFGVLMLPGFAADAQEPPSGNARAKFDPEQEMLTIANRNNPLVAPEGSCNGIAEFIELHWSARLKNPAMRPLAEESRSIEARYGSHYLSNISNFMQFIANRERFFAVRPREPLPVTFAISHFIDRLDKSPELVPIWVFNKGVGGHRIEAYDHYRLADGTIVFKVADPNFHAGHTESKSAILSFDAKELKWVLRTHQGSNLRYDLIAEHPTPRRNADQLWRLWGRAQKGTPLSEIMKEFGIAPKDAVTGILGPNEVGGVRILYQVLQTQTDVENERLFQQISESVAKEQGPQQRSKALDAFFQQLKGRLKGSDRFQPVGQLAVVSLKRVVEQAEKFRDRWHQLPDGLRKPGNLSRIHGCVIDAAHDDILILGRREPGMPVLELDDLTVGVRSVWKERQVPLCSLDPDLEDMQQGKTGPQRVRLHGVPKDSTFARSMLEADYKMKKVLLGIDRVEVSGYSSYKALLEKHPDPFQVANKASRYWFCPVAPTPGDIQVSGDRTVAVFTNRMQVLTEQMALTGEGMLGTGKVNPVAEEAADLFSRHLPAMARHEAAYHRLQVLFDVVLLARTWQEMNVKPAVIEKLCSLPYLKLENPSSYPGIRQTMVQREAVELFVTGGVEMKVAAGRQSWLVLDDEEIIGLRGKALGSTLAGSVTADLTDCTVRIAAPDLERAQRGSAVVALRKLQALDVDGALAEAGRAVQADPFDPEAWSVLALVLQIRGEVAEAMNAAYQARSLDPANPLLLALTAQVLSNCYALQGDGTAALAELDEALKLAPTNKQAHLRRGTVYAVLKKPVEAQLEFQKALEIDPTFAPAYARLALLEISQGRVARAQSMILKAQVLNVDLVEAKVTQAMIELMSGRMEAAGELAQEVVQHPACDPGSRIMAFGVRLTALASTDEWDKIRTLVRDANRTLPAFLRPQAFLVAAGTALAFDQKPLAEEYLREAEKLAPHLPQAKQLRKDLGTETARPLPQQPLAKPARVPFVPLANFRFTAWDSWNGFGVGSTVTLESKEGSFNILSPKKHTLTLTMKEPNKLTVQTVKEVTSLTVKETSLNRRQSTQSDEIIEKPKGPPDKDGREVKVETTTLKIGDREFECILVTITTAKANAYMEKSLDKTWYANVPGWVIQREVYTGAILVNKDVLISYEVKK